MKSIKKKWDVLLVGRYFCDLIFRDLLEFPRLGHEVYARGFHLIPGDVYTPAVALAWLGVRAAWLCVFGSDVFSQWVKSKALNEGVDGTYFSDSSHPLKKFDANLCNYLDENPRFPILFFSSRA